ncbi:MAG TPA: S8 family serine peptidase [Myxococcaceae bacterium]|nr:S8 family serine peptidase [Myxococcaceae bacterium]
MKVWQSVFTVSFLVLSACAPEASSSTSTPQPHLVTAGGLLRTQGDRVPEQYIVVLKDVAPGAPGHAVAEAARALEARHAVKAEKTWGHALRGFMVKASEAKARALAADPAVKYVVEDGLAYPDSVQTGPSWGLDRIDQQDRPASGSYTYTSHGYGVHAYVIDSGIRASHAEFGGRVSLDYTAVNDGNGASDCSGHGTHVAAIIGGATWGVAKGVNLHSVRVFGCTGSAPYSTLIDAVNWVTANHLKPAVVNLSASGGVNPAMDDAVRGSIDAGVTYALSAGNWNGDACSASPSRVAEAITVGATDVNDNRASYSNFGQCVDLFAPGTSITSAWYTNDTAIATMTGTSKATPFAAGAAALFLEFNPTASPELVGHALTGYSSRDQVINPGAGSPNRLLFANPYVHDPLTIVPRHSGQCLDVEGGSTDDWRYLIQYPCHEYSNQRFMLVDMGHGWYMLQAQHSGKCLEVAGGAYDEGTPIIQTSCHGGSSQQFLFLPTGDGFYNIRTQHSWQCLDIHGGSHAPGEGLYQYLCNGGPNQEFKFNF